MQRLKSSKISLVKAFLGSVVGSLIGSWNVAFSLTSYDKYWMPATLIGSLPNTNVYKYYFEPQLRLIDDPYVFNQLFLLGGLGYQWTSKVVFFTGPGWIVSKNAMGKMIQEKRFWQQLNWIIFSSSQSNLHSRTRLEEREEGASSQISIRFRERLWLRIPLQHQSPYFFSCFNEVFINLNYPVWRTPSWFEQNRAFIGMATQLSKSTLLDMGYLNQYLNAYKKESNKVFLLNLTVNL